MTLFVRMTDKFMSGWGDAAGKTNVLVVKCDTLEQAEQIETAAGRRDEMNRIEIMSSHPCSRANVLFTDRHYDDMGSLWKV